MPRGVFSAAASYVIYGHDLFPSPANLDDDGALTIFDLLAFQDVFDAGCQ